LVRRTVASREPDQNRRGATLALRSAVSWAASARHLADTRYHLGDGLLDHAVHRSDLGEAAAAISETAGIAARLRCQTEICRQIGGSRAGPRHRPITRLSSRPVRTQLRGVQ
jgi:hypothetical protein